MSESSSVVELHLAKVAVEGSNPFSRSNFFVGHHFMVALGFP